ncbi:COG1833 Uri superfamily endonuclease [Methylophilaceae bacterium]
MSNFVTYQLFIEVKQPVTLTIGKLGSFDFPAGHYIYTGSAKRNIEARIARHLAKDKKLRWHIDYLLNSTSATITKVEQFVEPECEINQKTLGAVLFPRFGASDCHAGCMSHLKYIAC